MKQDKALSLIGIATKAGKTVSGEFSTEKAVKEHQAYLVIVSSEASDNTRKKFQNMCDFYHVPICFYGTKADLGNVCGKQFRASLAVTDQGLSDAIMEKVTQGLNGGKL